MSVVALVPSRPVSSFMGLGTHPERSEERKNERAIKTDAVGSVTLLFPFRFGHGGDEIR